MSDKNKSQNPNKAAHSNQDHSNQGHSGNPNQGGGSFKGKSDHQMDQGSGMSGGGNFKERGRMADEGSPKAKEWNPEVSNPAQPSWIPEISSSPTSLFSRMKNACLPKALMLALPFIALGVYLVLGT